MPKARKRRLDADAEGTKSGSADWNIMKKDAKIQHAIQNWQG